MNRQRILITGDREWAGVEADHAVATVIRGLDLWVHWGDVVVHGAARGVDSIAEPIAKFLGIPTESYPADWDRYGPAAGPIRNQEMLDSGIDECWAFHDNLAASRGTRDMVERCKAARVPVYVVSRILPPPELFDSADHP